MHLSSPSLSHFRGVLGGLVVDFGVVFSAALQSETVAPKVAAYRNPELHVVTLSTPLSRGYDTIDFRIEAPADRGQQC